MPWFVGLGLVLHPRGISRPAVISAAEPITLELMEGSGQPALQVDGEILRRMQPGDALEIRLRPRAGLVVRLDPERYQRRSPTRCATCFRTRMLWSEMSAINDPVAGSTRTASAT